MRVVLRAGFDRFSGYGNDAVDLAVNLEKAGVDVLPWPMSVRPGLPRSFTRLLEKNPVGKKDVVLTFAPPFDLKPWEFNRLAPKVAAYTMWERTPVRVEDFDGHGWDTKQGRAALRSGKVWSSYGVDHLFVTCPMNVDAFRGVDTEVPMSVVPCGIEEDDWPFERRDPQRRMQFLMAGMLGGRKVPFVLLDAWREVKREHPEFDAKLVMHTLAPGLHPKIPDAYPDVEISMRPLDRKGLICLYHASDVLVSVSRGEGNNKPAMEFMATGGTVIASDWSGHQNWLHRDVSFPVGGTLEAAVGAPGAEEFAIDHEGLKAALYSAWLDRAGTARKGMRAARWIRESLAWPVVVEKMVRTLEGL